MARRRYQNICPHCGAWLDAGEHCDCREKAEKEKELKLLIAIDAYMDRAAVRKRA